MKSRNAQKLKMLSKNYSKILFLGLLNFITSVGNLLYSLECNARTLTWAQITNNTVSTSSCRPALVFGLKQQLTEQSRSLESRRQMEFMRSRRFDLKFQSSEIKPFFLCRKSKYSLIGNERYR